MSRLMSRFISGVRRFFAGFFLEILAFITFCAAGLAWAYFSTAYAVIPVFIIGIALGGYIYGLIEGEKSEPINKEK
ncbi:MAG: hypothetical protein HY308_11855 [Gammaproteobacteria bacterium]|nr:hypothetical protein [Gammaproteobacteria bacterium]